MAAATIGKQASAIGASQSSGFAMGKVTFIWTPPVFEGELIAPAEIKVVVVDRLGNWIQEVEDAAVNSIKWELNRPGEATIVYHPLATGASDIHLVKRELQIWMDDELVWWGVPWRRNGGVRGLAVQCEGLMSLFTKRFVDRSTLFYTSLDQLAIAWDLLRYAQDNTIAPNRDFHISSAEFLPSGHARSRNYERNEHANILDLLEAFTKLDDGFDYDLVVYGDGRREWTPYYPKKGVVRDEFRMEYHEDGERGIADFAFAEDAVGIATEAYATGGSEGEVKFEQRYEDVLASAEYGVMQKVVSEGSQKDVGWLLERATKEVKTFKNPVITPQITAANVPMRLFGQISVGDWLPMGINYGSIIVGGYYRIKTITWTPGDRFALTFVEQI